MSQAIESKLEEKHDKRSRFVAGESVDNQDQFANSASIIHFPRPHYIVENENPISFTQAENMIQAGAHARAIGYALNYHLIVNVNSWDWHKHSELLREIAQWQRNNFGQAVFIWARERQSGEHSHILLHIPYEKSVNCRKAIRRWLKKILGRTALPIRSMRIRSVWDRGNPDANIRNRIRYLLKGANTSTRQFFGVDKDDPFFVANKRCGVSQSLGIAARKKAGGTLPSGTRMRSPSDEMLANLATIIAPASAKTDRACDVLQSETRRIAA